MYYEDIKNGENYQQLKKLIEPLYRYDDYYGEYDKEEAKNILKEFFMRLRDIKPDNFLDLGPRRDYYSFYINLLPVWKALQNQQYAIACHEIATLNHYEPMLQKRIYRELMKLYKKFLRR